jgi:hypothetical protein
MQLSTSIKIKNEFIILHIYTSYIYISLTLEIRGHEKYWHHIYYYHHYHLVTLYEIKSR